jgi:hypothetical protein
MTAAPPSANHELSEIMEVWHLWGNAAKEPALKVLLKNASAGGGELTENL